MNMVSRLLIPGAKNCCLTGKKYKNGSIAEAGGRMKQQGWIKLHRQIIEHWVFEDDPSFKLFCYCILRANHKDRAVLIDGNLCQCTIGSFITSKHKLADFLKVSRKKLDRLLKPLIKEKMLEIKTHHNYTTITVCNYRDFQLKEIDESTTDDTPTAPLTTPQPHHKRTTTAPQAHTDKNDLRINNNDLKNEENEKEVPPHSEDEDLLEARENLHAPTGSEPWEKTNDFILLGRRPMKNYPDIFMTPGDLAQVIKIYDDNLKGENWKPMFLQCEAEIKTQMAKGIKRERISALKYLTTFCLETALRLKNERVKIQRNSERPNYAPR